MSESTLKPINILGTQGQSTTPSAMTPAMSGQMSTKNPMTPIPSSFPDNLKPEASVTSSEANLMAERFQNQSRLKQPDLTALRRFSVDQIFAYKKIVEWKALPGYSFIKPIQKQDGSEADQIGIVKYSDGSFKEGELVGYNQAAEYEFVIGKDRLYRVPNIFIEIKYEYKGKEKEYNPSWLQSG